MVQQLLTLIREQRVVLGVLVVCVALAAIIGLGTQSVTSAAWAGLVLGIFFGMFIGWYTSREERAAQRKRR